MIVIPAVDIKGGKSVRLLRGRAEDETVYFDDPLDAAQKWLDGGAEMLHVVDLDGAFSGKLINTPHIERIVRAAGNVPVEASGGLRTADDVKKLLDCGASRVVIGTIAAESIEKLTDLCSQFPEKIAVGVDAQHDMVAVEGWTSTTDLPLIEFIKTASGAGPCAIIYTDVSRDGALSGPNFERTADVCNASRVPIVASGGVSSLDDLQRLSGLPVEGAIVGKALFEEMFTLPEAIEAGQRI
jgi:phosphoribosylformimino-5-aminoimidazole carboxamide ribotide isomerase